MKVALITDTHFGARNDNMNFNEYDVWTKILKENIIDKILKFLSKKEINAFNLIYHDKTYL